MAKRLSHCAPLHFVKLLYAQLLLKQLAINDTLIYENLFSPTNIGLASHNHADSVVVKSNITEHTENTDIYNSTSNVYQQSNHSISLDIVLSSACIWTVTDHATTCLPISVDFDLFAFAHITICKGFLYSKGNPFYIQPVNLNFNYLDHLSSIIFIRRQQKETLSS